MGRRAIFNRSRTRRGVGASFAALWLAVVALTSAAAQAAPGDVYVVDQSAFKSGNTAGAVFRVGPGGGDATPIVQGSPFQTPSGMVMNKDGNLLVADDGNIDPGAIFQIDPRTGARSTFASGLPLFEPVDLAFGPDGMLYVTDYQSVPPGLPELIRLDPTTKVATVIATGSGDWTSSAGIAVARDGTIYFTDGGVEVFKRDPISGAISTLAKSSLLNGADGIALSPDDRTLFIAAYGNENLTSDPPNRVLRLDTQTGQLGVVATTNDSVAVALLPDGSLLNSDTDDSVDGFQGIQRIVGSTVSTFSTDPDYSYPHDIVVEPARCAGLIPTVVGTDGPDVLTGSPFADVFSTLGGKDTVRAGGGKDIVCGGPGKDTLAGQAGKDRLLGQGGPDLLKGGKGNDVCKGGKGKDRGSSCEKGKLG